MRTLVLSHEQDQPQPQYNFGCQNSDLNFLNEMSFLMVLFQYCKRTMNGIVQTRGSSQQYQSQLH